MPSKFGLFIAVILFNLADMLGHEAFTRGRTSTALREYRFRAICLTPTAQGGGGSGGGGYAHFHNPFDIFEQYFIFIVILATYSSSFGAVVLPLHPLCLTVVQVLLERRTRRGIRRCWWLQFWQHPLRDSCVLFPMKKKKRG